jgi:hypothetical protein
MPEISEAKLYYLKSLLKNDLLDNGVHSVILIDRAVNILINLNNDPLDFDYYSLASLAAANVEAVSIWLEF